MATGPDEKVIIEGLCEALLKCNNKAQPATDPIEVQVALLNVLQHQYPDGPASPQEQYPLGCCRIGPYKLPNWPEAECNALGGTWTEGACP